MYGQRQWEEGIGEDVLSEFPCFDTAQARTKWACATTLPPHEFVGGDRDEEDATGDDRLVDETAGERLPLERIRRIVDGARTCSLLRRAGSGWWPLSKEL